MLATLAPSAASAESFAQARSQLRSWGLQPRPLFPSHLPSAHRNAPVSVYHSAYTSPGRVDYSFYFGAPPGRDCQTLSNPNGWCVGLSRWQGSAYPPRQRAFGFSRLRIGRRRVYFWDDAGNAGGWYMTWSEHGRAYSLWAWLDHRGAALARLRPFLKSLHTV